MNIYQKLIEVRKAVPYLKRENEGYQFKFVSSSQTLGALKNKMDALQLLLIPSVTSKAVSEKATAKGGKEYFTELEMDFKWVNAEDPQETITCHWYGQGLDTGEKGVGKALTYAEKYFMLKFFNIPTDKDDPDSFQDKIDNKTPAKPPVQPKVTTVIWENVKQDEGEIATHFKNRILSYCGGKGHEVEAKAKYEEIIARVKDEPEETEEELNNNITKNIDEVE